MDVFLCAPDDQVFSQLETFAFEFGLTLTANGLHLSQRPQYESYFGKHMELFAGRASDVPIDKVTGLVRGVYLEEKINLLMIERLPSPDLSLILATRISWLPSRSPISKKIGRQLVRFLRSKNFLGMESYHQKDAYMNLTLKRKYYWHESLLTSGPEQKIFEFFNSTRLLPLKHPG